MAGVALLAGDEGDPFAQEDPLGRKRRKCRIPCGSQLIEERLPDGHRVNRLVLGSREVHSGYKDVPPQGIIFCGM